MLKQLSAFLSVFFLVFLSSQSQASDTPATTTNTGHGNVAPVIVIEYPPFISQQQPDFGMSFRILTEQLAVHGWQAEPVFLPPARAAQRVLEANDWLLSFYPPADHAEPVVLKAAAIKYSLFRRTQPQPFRWQNPAELGPGVLVVTRQLPGSKELNYFRDADFEVIYVNQIEQAVQMLLAGRADYMLTTEDTGWYYLQQLKADPAALQFAETLVRTYPHSVYINPRHPQAEIIKKILQ
ncbi:hypothetical protein GJQ55_10930 [Venatoribacter cucullus]|uniref:Solute-binding protein family 3/N-terminal domain-containing protein n=1 Tax=Venatoribacter cucullus TaxID=2661630 RepID=A0A9X7UXP5_9GAMM|nr:hypothetical protein [Venatoribacter cucullus]QQD24952.1 hypothetical protein GJQ55_10930 [Venatoribacter cucullus]